jgi:hypothetical protein
MESELGEGVGGRGTRGEQLTCGGGGGGGLQREVLVCGGLSPTCVFAICVCVTY